MAEVLQGVAVLAPRQYHNNPGIEVHILNPEVIERARGLMLQYLHEHDSKNMFGYFEQGHDPQSWIYFEFWRSPSDDAVLDMAEWLAAELGLELDLR